MTEPLAYPWEPDYVVPTSEVLREWLQTNHLSARVAAACVSRDPGRKDHAACRISAILNRDSLTERDAEMLQVVTGVSKRFWLSFEHNYRAGLAAGKVEL